MMLHSPTPMLSVPHRHAPHTSTACSRWHAAGPRRQRGPRLCRWTNRHGPFTPSRKHRRESHRKCTDQSREETGNTNTRMNIFFHIIWILRVLQTYREMLLYFGHESTLNYKTSVNSISPQKSYSKTKMFLFSLLHNQSNFPSRTHLDTAVSCYAAPLVAVWLLASMLNQLDQIPNYLRHDFLPKNMFCECNNTRNAILTHCLSNTRDKTREDIDYANWKTFNIMHYDSKLLIIMQCNTP